MKTTVKTFWICMLLMLTCSISGKAIDLVQVDDRMAGTAEVSASLSSCSSTSDNSIDKKNSLFTNTKFAWTTDVELKQTGFRNLLFSSTAFAQGD